MSGLWLDYKIGFCKSKQKKSVQHSKEDSMTGQWTRGGSNQTQGRQKTSTLVESNYFYTGNHYQFLSMCNAICVYAAYMVVTLHSVCEGLLYSKYQCSLPWMCDDWMTDATAANLILNYYTFLILTNSSEGSDTNLLHVGSDTTIFIKYLGPKKRHIRLKCNFLEGA